MILENARDHLHCFGENDLYIFTLGHEHRSCFLYDELKKKYPNATLLVFASHDYTKYPDIARIIEEIKRKGNTIHLESYNNSNDVHEKIIEFVSRHIAVRETVTVHIDYSSMPRSWYCKLPMLLHKIIRNTDKVFFWYSEGDYPSTHEEYPSSGIDSFSFFSGKPSLQVEKSRVHVVALGYDIIRTQAILSITDPSYLVSCYAYSPAREGFLENLKEINDPILTRSAISLGMDIEDFDFMVSKLCDTVNELLPIGNVILIPDGPKPLIFALSLVPDLIGKPGITCLHISRNNDCFESVNVTATGKVYGFLLQVE